MGMSAAGDTALPCRLCLRCHKVVCARNDIKHAIACDRLHIPGRSLQRSGVCKLHVASTPVLSSRCVGAAAAAGTSMSGRCPTHLGLPQGELPDARVPAAHSRSFVATQSRQIPRRRALPPQRRQSRRRNFALDLPLVA
jgi:hypothetical protein